MKRVWWLVALIVVAFLAMPGCGGGDGPGPGTMTLDSFSDQSENKRIIRATVRNKDNQMMEDVLVNFSTTSGSLSPTEVPTNRNGIADVVLSLDAAFPIATVTATTTGSYQGYSVDAAGNVIERPYNVDWHDNIGTGTISASIQVYLVENIRLFNIEAGPTADTRTIRVLVTGPREIPLENVAVRFHSSGGQFVDPQNNPAPIPEVRTNRHGIGLIHLRSTHPVTVTARADNKSTQFPVQF